MYETELMRQILKSPMAQKMIQEITPKYGSAYAFLWLMQVIGAEWDEMNAWCEDLRAQTMPQTATWTLEYWERRFGITPDPSLPDEQRQAIVVATMASRGPMNPARLEQIASAAAGYPAEISENTGKNRFSIFIEAAPWLVNEEAVRKAINKVKPARLIYDIAYERAVEEEAFYIGGAVTYSKEITMTQRG